MQLLAWLLLIAVGCLLPTRSAMARKTNGPLYEDPFDLAAGGASLTRASKEGVLYSNPALLPLGDTLWRWTGLTATVIANKESIATARQIAAQSKAPKTDDPAATQSQATELIDKVFKDPVHVGWGAALSLLTTKVGVSAFSRFAVDIRAREFGPTGLPQVELRTESYHGAAIGAGLRTPWPWLTFGATAKYVYAGEQDIQADVSDAATISGFAQQHTLQNLAALNTGAGLDVGSLMFFQGQTVDLVVATKIDDLGTTKLTGKAPEPVSLRQVASVGLGLTLHTGADALHFAADYRDVGGIYKEDLFKKLYLGTKLTLRTYFGLAAGFYNGYPSLGAEIDLLFCRLAATAYTRELGEHPGVDPRHLYMVSFSTGF